MNVGGGPPLSAKASSTSRLGASAVGIAHWGRTSTWFQLSWVSTSSRPRNSKTVLPEPRPCTPRCERQRARCRRFQIQSFELRERRRSRLRPAVPLSRCDWTEDPLHRWGSSASLPLWSRRSRAPHRETSGRRREPRRARVSEAPTLPPPPVVLHPSHPAFMRYVSSSMSSREK